MDYTYSPHRPSGGMLHLPSPTHHHGCHVDGFPSIRQIRRSLSRSPSRPSRFQIYQSGSPSESPKSPISPLALARAFTPKPAKEPQSPSAAASASLQSAAKKTKFTLRRTAPFRSSPRKFRRALSDSLNQGNATPPSSSESSRRSSGDENSDEIPQAAYGRFETEPKPVVSRREVNDGPIKFELSKPKLENATPRLPPRCDVPVKSSPLKRSDGIMNLDQASLASPVAKRRSLHGAMYGADFDIFDHGPGSTSDGGNDSDRDHAGQFPSPAARRASPLRKSLSLRKSTLQQRHGSGIGRSRPAQEHEFLVPGQAASKSRNRMSLDSSLPFAGSSTQSPLRRVAPFESAQLGQQQQPPMAVFRASSGHNQQPHPLSNALTPSSSDSNMEDSPTHTPAPPPPNVPPRHPINFSRSLPIGAIRPAASSHATAKATENGSFSTPEAYKMAKPHPAAFMSTGLISKRNRNVDVPPAGSFASYAMPDTPSKRVSFPPMNATPMSNSFSKQSHQLPEFGTPSSPFSFHAAASPKSFGKGVSIFGDIGGKSSSHRRSSFVSIDGDDIAQSPSNRIDSQSSNEDLPPTPTKKSNSFGRNSKENSLRSSLFGRRVSLGPDTFVPPGDDRESPSEKKGRSSSSKARGAPVYSVEDPSALSEESPSSRKFATFPTPQCRSHDASSPLSSKARAAPSFVSSAPMANIAKSLLFTPAASFGFSDSTDNHPPHTPSEPVVPPDPSNLSISAHHNRRTSFNFGSSTNSNLAFPPATPTAPREQAFFFGDGQPVVAPLVGLTHNDIDTTLTARFGSVTTHGNGEFSQVFRVERALQSTPSRSGSSRAGAGVGKVWAVKKTKRPYVGTKDRSRKMREVQILSALRGHDHIINYTDSWEAKGHLYIQTEFCENGNLKDFLAQAGFKGRLDDFRIWKILLELSLGVKFIHDAGFIHLDLKPANVFIDWEGVLKIGDFGLASTWPAPPNIDGEGDREYIGPEVLSGKFDKPADIFALGMIMLEIAGNIVLPDNGTSWRRLRAGDLSDLPSLTWSSESTLTRDESGDPIGDLSQSDRTTAAGGNPLCLSDDEEDTDDSLTFLRDMPTAAAAAAADSGHGAPAPPVLPVAVPAFVPRRPRELVTPPNFMVDPEDPQALDRIVQWMISPRPGDRPRVAQVAACGGARWVEGRRRAGATIYEGNWGPADDVLEAAGVGVGAGGGGDVDMVDA